MTEFLFFIRKVVYFVYITNIFYVHFYCWLRFKGSDGLIPKEQYP